MSASPAELAARLPGRVAVAGDEGWDVARQCWNLAVDQQPGAVVFPDSAHDVAAAVAFASDNGLRIAFQGGGHNTAPISWSERVLLLRTERMRRIEVDPARRRARIEAGVLSDELAAAAAVHGLAFLAGTSPDVGVVGYALGGGLSWMVRKHGLAANSILAADVVTADGRLVRADRDHEPDLFWAIRGGGGNFGAITALELELYPVPEIYAGALFWPIERGVEILNAWRGWLGDVPDECTSLGRILKLPDLPELPGHLRGRSFAMVELAFLGSESAGAALIEPLRGLGPELDTVATISPGGLSAVNMDPPAPVPVCGDGINLEELTEATVTALVETMLESRLIHAEVRHLGGAVAAGSPEHGALDAIESPFAMFGLGLVRDAEEGAAVARDLALLHEALAPWDHGRRYLNFTESPVELQTLFSEESYRRLCELKARYDPGHLFLANHPLAPDPTL